MASRTVAARMVGMPRRSRSMRTSACAPATTRVPEVTGSTRWRYTPNATPAASSKAASSPARRTGHFKICNPERG
jgi:hypothetical protein